MDANALVDPLSDSSSDASPFGASSTGGQPQVTTGEVKSYLREEMASVLSILVVVAGWVTGMLYLPSLVAREGTLKTNSFGQAVVYLWWTVFCALGVLAPTFWLVLVVPATLVAFLISTLSK